VVPGLLVFVRADQWHRRSNLVCIEPYLFRLIQSCVQVKGKREVQLFYSPLTVSSFAVTRNIGNAARGFESPA